MTPTLSRGAQRGALLGAALALAGCGISYTSPSVRSQVVEGATLDVVALSLASVSTANAQTYVPRQLPAIFSAGAGSGSGIVGAGALPRAPQTPDLRQGRAVFDPPPSIPATPYRIGVGDVVLLSTRTSGRVEDQLSGLLAATNSRQGYTVRDDGAIAIPDVGSVALSGLTLQEAEDALFAVLVENQFDPSFSLEIAEFNSQKVAVGGEVRAARTVPITLQPVTLGAALIAAGDISVRDKEFGVIRIFRDGRLYQIPLETYRARPELTETLMQNGDAIFVDTTYDLDRAFAYFNQEIEVISLRSQARQTALAALQTEVALQRAALDERRDNFQARVALDAEDRDFVYLTGEVVAQTRVALPYERQATLADVLFGEGGFDTTTGDPSQIYVLRADKTGAAFTAYHLNAANAANMILATRLQMRPNDIVFVEEQPITKWNRALQQAFPVLLNTTAAAATRP